MLPTKGFSINGKDKEIGRALSVFNSSLINTKNFSCNNTNASFLHIFNYKDLLYIDQPKIQKSRKHQVKNKIFFFK